MAAPTQPLTVERIDQAITPRPRADHLALTRGPAAHPGSHRRPARPAERADGADHDLTERPDMPELAKKITIDRKRHKVYVDGVEFPWYIEEQGPRIDDPDTEHGAPVVHLPVIAGDLEIIPKD